MASRDNDFRAAASGCGRNGEGECGSGSDDNEQAAWLQVNGSTSTLDASTQQTAGNSEELAAAAEQLSSQVTCLRDLVGKFRVAL